MQPAVSTDQEKISELLSRFVCEVIDKEALHARLVSGERLRVKLGIDPTSPDIHLGRAVLLLKLRDFQELGHQIVLIIGDATGVIGDTSDKDSERPMLTRQQIKKNAVTYLDQASRLLSMKEVEVHYNSEWLDALSYREIGEQADQFSVADFTARDNIKRRLDAGKRVSLREVLYPLMQGYDSVVVKSDVELGGIDQRFNLLAGRALQAHYKQPPQNILMTDLIKGLDGRKMSSSWGNTVNITDDSNDMYGKLMRLRDENIEAYLVSSTRVPLREIEDIKKQHPRDMKMRLAKEVVALYHSADAARDAQETFVTTFQKGEVPSGVEEVEGALNMSYLAAIVASKVVESRTKARRLILDGAVFHVDTGEKVTDPDAIVQEGVYKVGKRRFLRVKKK